MVREKAIKAIQVIMQKEELPKNILERYSETLNGRDRAFLMELVYGVLRYRDTLDWVLKPSLRKPSRLKAFTLNNLRLAIYQLMYTRVPVWAAIHESVEMEKRWGHPELVNAVLRNFLNHRAELKFPSFNENPLSHISIKTSHPQWLVKRWIKRFGVEETLKLAEANNSITAPTLRVNTMISSRQEVSSVLGDLGIHYELTRYSPVGIRLKENIPFKVLKPLKGKIFVQDEAAQLVSFLLIPERGDTILDACAAPGGKTTHIATLTYDNSFILAVDNKEARMKKLIENAKISELKSIKPVIADIENIVLKRKFDKILLDAPCSSTGIIRKNPDIKYKHNLKKIKEYAKKQLLFLHSVSKFLKNGGLLVYSVCSTEPEEGENVIKDFLQKNPDFFIIDRTEKMKTQYGIDLSFFLTDNYFYRTFPHKHRLDGFFFVTLTRK